VKRLAFSLLPFKSAIGYTLASGRTDHPVFLVGCARSGTTALGRALGTHPEILYCAREAPLVNYLARSAYHYRFSDVCDYVQESTRLQESDLSSKLKTLCYESVWGRHFGLKDNLSYLRRNRKLPSGSMWLVKAFPDENEGRGLTWLYPNAKYVYIHRNGIDVVNSMMSFGWYSKQSFAKLCEHWSIHMARYAYLTRKERAVAVRYDDFLQVPSQVFERVFDHLGISHDESPLAFSRTNLVHPLGEPDKQTDPRKVLTKREPSFERWHEKSRRTFKDICGDEMRKNGYALPF